MLLKFIMLCFCCIGIASAMDPTLAQGQTRIMVSFLSHDATSFFNYEELATSLNLSNRVADYSSDAYELEYTYGWTNDIAIILRSSQEQRAISSSAEKQSHDGIPGYYLAMRQRIGLGQATHLFAETGVRFDEEDEEPLPLSSGGTHWYAVVSYNQSFLPSRAGFEMDFGYSFMGGDAEDEFFFKTRLHLDFLKIVNLSLGYHALESKADKKIPYTPTQWPNELGFQDAEVALSRELGRSFLLELAYQSRLKGRNQFETEGFKLSFSWWKSR